MRMTTTQRSTHTLSFSSRAIMIAAVLGVSLAGANLALGQTSNSGGAPASNDPLSGPKTNDRTLPGRTFGDQQMGKGEGKFAQHEPPLGPMLRSLREMAGDSAPANVKLTSEQSDQIKAIAKDFQTQMKAYRNQHADEIKAIRAKAGLPEEPAGGPGGPGGPGGGVGEHRRRPSGGGPGGPGAGGGAAGPDAGGPGGVPTGADAKDPKVKAAMEQLHALMQNGPKPTDAEAKIYAVLNDSQKAYLKTEMGKFQDERRARMEELKGKGKAGKGAGKGGKRPPSSGGDGAAPGGAAPAGTSNQPD